MKADDREIIFEEVRTGSSDRFLAREDVDVALKGLFGRTLLHEAIAFERQDIAEALLGRGAPVDAEDQNGQTPLHYAGTYSNRSVAAQLLAQGSDPNRQDIFGNTPLWSAALARDPDYALIRLLVEKGADPAHVNKAGRSVLDFARQADDKELWACCTGSEDGFDEEV
jgi:ankyrin repeat protein